MVAFGSWLLHAPETGTIDGGLTVAVVAGGTLAGLALARLAVGQRPEGAWIRAFLLAVLVVMAGRTGLAFAGLGAGSFHALEHVLDAAMIALTVATLYAARTRRRELGTAGSPASR
ncbi:hypothetical protein [Halorhabdus amylolytica]|uniref:hypothetical protein n=1 Tax=Halorhabdus amylolytica TaxID=2559573 RepID=UPI0010A9EBAA|nr:hypothetical protein [Halorhabdus amylolytica]